MKRTILIALIALTSIAMLGQTYSINVTSDYIKIDATQSITSTTKTAYLYCSDIKYAWSGDVIYLSNKSTGWDFTIDYDDITSFNGGAVPAVAAIKAMIFDSVSYMKNADKRMMGLNGHYPAITTTATTYIPLGWCVNALEATVIASLSFSNAADSLTTITLAAGQSIYGKFKHIKLTSGKVIVYK